MAAELNQHKIVETLFDLNIIPDIRDYNGNNAFHIACLRANSETCQVFMERKLFDIRQTNGKGQNVSHCLAVASDKSQACSIFEQLFSCYQDLDLNARDGEGSTPLLLGLCSLKKKPNLYFC